MVEKKTWEEFIQNGLLWWINMILHTMGWAIVCEKENDEVVNVYPARVKYRGFSESSNTKGYINISNYMKENADKLLEEASN